MPTMQTPATPPNAYKTYGSASLKEGYGSYSLGTGMILSGA